MIEAVVLRELIDQDPILLLDTAAQQAEEVRMLGLADAFDLCQEFLDPLFRFTR